MSQSLSETIVSSFDRATPMFCRNPGGPLGMRSLWPRLLAD